MKNISIKLLKIKYEIILLFPLALNFLNNLIGGDLKKFTVFNIYDFFSSILLFFFFYRVGKIFQTKYSVITISFGIYMYLVSFFIFETLILFLYKNVNLDISFFVVNIFWIVFFLFNKKNLLNILNAIFSYIVQKFFHTFYLKNFSINLNILGDVKDVFFRQTENIYNYSYFYSVTNPVIEGYPQFLSYIDALLFKISFDSSNYAFMQTNSLVFFWLSLLLIYELPLSKFFKYYAILLYSILVLNSGWLQFLFISSLMSERLAGYLFFTAMLCILNASKNNKLQMIFLLFFGFNFFNKQFFSIITLVVFLFFIISKKNKKYSYIILFAPLLKKLSYFFYFKGLDQDRHISQIDLVDTIYDLFLFRDVKYNNIKLIIINLFEDKPVTYFLFLLLLSTLYLLYFKLEISVNYFFILFLILFNFILIFIIYSSVWRNMELLSPIRYIYSFLIIYIFTFSFNLETLRNSLSIKPQKNGY